MQPLRLENKPTIVVIGGGPAGAFFTLNLLRKSRALGREPRIIILERRKECLPLMPRPSSHRRGCNYCAGGISPRLNDILRGMGLALPVEVVKNEIHSITVQCFWKNIEFKVPVGRQMLAVYRGSLPSHRGDGLHNFDAFLLEQCLKEGGILYEAEATHLSYSEQGKLLVTYKDVHGPSVMEADFVAWAGGVNYRPGHLVESAPLVQSLLRLVPGFVPPRVRRALVFELEVDQACTREMEGEIFFNEYGSKSLPLEMCSLVPKGQFITVVLIGRAIDRLADHAQFIGVIHEFLMLPHIKKLLPRKVKLENPCICNPNMVIGTAKHPFGHRLAIIGDMATARLYKDGILTAYQTALALADTILQRGVDARSLARGYWPELKKVRADNRYGRLVYTLHNLIFSSSILSRVVYQAIIAERKKHRKIHRQLENILWRMASGDDQYKGIWASMIHPLTVWSILTRGILLTLRNFITEKTYGLRWQGFGRFTTGVSMERLEAKRLDYRQVMAGQNITPPPHLEFERMYSIKIKANRRMVKEEIGRFGESDRAYFRPRWVEIHRIHGQPNQPGCVIQYRVGFSRLNFSLILAGIIDQRYFLYRVRDGFARDGVLIFEIEEMPKGISLLSIYVAFDFRRGISWFTKPWWMALKCLFPAFVHDVLWNHSLCQLKDHVEGVSAANPSESLAACPGALG